MATRGERTVFNPAVGYENLTNQKVTNFLEIKFYCMMVFPQSERAERWQIELCSNYDREHGFDVMLR